MTEFIGIPAFSHMDQQTAGHTSGGGEETVRESFQHYLCLTDLLDQDLSAYEYFQTLSPEMQTTLRREDGNIGTLDELQARVAHLQSSSLMG